MSEKKLPAVALQETLARLAELRLAPIPVNYAVLYHYVTDEMPSLSAAIDAILAKGQLTQSDCVELYRKFISAQGKSTFYEAASATIDAELKKVMELIGSSMRDNTQFGENLDQFSGKLSGAHSIEMLREAVEKIADETRIIAAQNEKLQTELEETTSQLSEMRNDFDRVHKEAHLDSLTEIGNRKFFDREILQQLGIARENGIPMCLLMVDIDYFKNFNDMHGHQLGDQVLRLVARTLVENLKGRDVIARYGGEEFVILLPQTRLRDAEKVADHLRASLSTKYIRKRGSQEVLGVVTVSVGAAQYVAGEEAESLIARADAALYKAKESGRNRVVCLAAEQE